MKVKIRQDVFEKALEKGTIAALSDAAQTDTSNMSPLVKSARITANSKALVIESSTDKISVKYTVTVKKDNGIVVEESGSGLVPAKELIGWVKAQGSDATIKMNLSKLSTPEIIDTVESLDSSDNKDFTISKIGSLKLTSQVASKTGRKWELDVFEPGQRSKVDFKDKGEKHFDIQAKKFSECLARIGFASLKNDYEHVLDSVSIQAYKKNLYFF